MTAPNDTPENDAANSAAATPDESQPLKVVDRRWWAREETGSDDDSDPSRKPSYVEELEQRVKAQEALAQKACAQFKAAEQDFEAGRVRLRREIAKDVDRERRNILRQFLEVADNLERGLDAARDVTKVEDLRVGIEMVRDQLLLTLQGFGVTRLDAMAQPFDPTLHEAISTIETTDPTAIDTVASVVKPGYAIGEEVLRAAVVTVAKGPSEAEDAKA